MADWQLPTKSEFGYEWECKMTKALRPWTEMVRLHPDVECGELTEGAFASDRNTQRGYDPSWLRNAVEEPLAEVDVEFEEGGNF